MTATSVSPSSRRLLVTEIRERLEAETFPRTIVLLMLLAAGGAAFLGSVWALAAGVESMALRYPLAGAAGYAVFLLLVRVWIAIRRGWSAAEDVPIDVAVDAAADPTLLSAMPRQAAGELADAASHGFDWSFDLDDLWWLAVAGLAAVAGLVAVALVVYAAPVLLAEVALDAALVGTVYRRLRDDERGYWAATVVRQTGPSALVLVVFLAVLGFALQQLVPDAVSVGDVIRRTLAR